MSENGNLIFLREGAPLLLGGAGAEMDELGILRTCRPGKGTVPTKNRDPERHTTQHAGKVEARGTGGGEGACGDAKRRASRPTGAGMRREMNFQEVEAHCGTSGTGSAGLGSGYGPLRGGATPRPQTKHGRPPSRFPARKRNGPS